MSANKKDRPPNTAIQDETLDEDEQLLSEENTQPQKVKRNWWHLIARKIPFNRYQRGQELYPSGSTLNGYSSDSKKGVIILTITLLILLYLVVTEFNKIGVELK